MIKKSFVATPVLKDKFWIINEGDTKIGTLAKDNDNYIFSGKGEISFYTDKSELLKKFGKNFLTAKITTPQNKNKEFYVHDYPTRSEPFNSMYDISRKLPLFTKSEKSKSVYCAGYYLIKERKKTKLHFCPKIIMLERNEFEGPLKSTLGDF